MKADTLNNASGLSFDLVLVRPLDGGGGKTGFDPGSGDDLYAFAGGIRVAGDIPDASSSAAVIDV